MSILPSAFVLAALLASGEEPTAVTDRPAEQQTKLRWFEGSWDQLMERAAAEERLVFVEFWASWCVWCRKFESTTLSDHGVRSELKELLCYSIDAESREGKALAERFGVRDYPTLIFLEASGEVRDVITDYHSAKEFRSELRRIKRNEGTLGRLRQRIAAAPRDLEARYELANKLRKLGDKAGAEEQISAILKLDPTGESIVARRIHLDSILDQARQDLRLEPLYTFIEDEWSRELLYPAWQAAWAYERTNVERARRVGDPRPHVARWLHASRSVWEYVPEELRAKTGNNVAWWIYENRDLVGEMDLRFALDVAQRTTALVPRDPYVVDTLACCLFALGEQEEAIATMRRVIELDPENPAWRQRLEQFRAARSGQ